MNINSPSGKAHFHIIFAAIAVFALVTVFFKPAMKAFYPVKYINIIEEFSQKYDLDKYMVMALISTESKFDKDARSHKNAKGLMQLKEETARWCIEQFGIESDGKELDIYSPRLNIQTGTAYLKYLSDKFQNTNTALAAYNAGEGNVAKWLDRETDGTSLDEIPFAETEKYVKTVNKRTIIYRFLY